jgi:hypothetical protein
MVALDALRKLKEVVKQAAEEGQRTELHSAKEKLDEAVKKYTAAKADAGDYAQEKEYRLKEVDDMLTSANVLGAHIPEGTDIAALVEQAKNEIQAEYDSVDLKLRQLYDRVLDARKSLDDVTASLKIVPDLDLSETPMVMLQDLFEELRTSAQYFEDVWSQGQRKAMLAVWGARAKKLQEMALSEEETGVVKSIFSRLTAWSSEFRPGYVHALHRDFTAEDWDAYMDEAMEDFKYASEIKESDKKRKLDAAARAKKEHERKLEAHQVLEERLPELEALLGQERYDDAKACVATLLGEGIEPSDDDLLTVLEGHERLFQDGGQFRALRRNLSKVIDTIEADFPAVFELTKGKKAALVGGDCKPKARQLIEKKMGFSSLEWVVGSGNYVQQTCNRVDHYDFIFQLVRCSGHDATTNLKRACADSDCMFIMVPGGYSATSLASLIQEVIE